MKMKSWLSTLPVGKEFAVYDSNQRIKAYFKLTTYKIQDGNVNLKYEVNGSVQVEAGMGEATLGKDITVRLHIPIELYYVNKIGHSLKVVYRLPADYMVEEFERPKPESLYDRARQHTFERVGDVV